MILFGFCHHVQCKHLMQALESSRFGFFKPMEIHQSCGLGFDVVLAVHFAFCYKHFYHEWCAMYRFINSSKCVQNEHLSKATHVLGIKSQGFQGGKVVVANP